MKTLSQYIVNKVTYLEHEVSRDHAGNLPCPMFLFPSMSTHSSRKHVNYMCGQWLHWAVFFFLFFLAISVRISRTYIIIQSVVGLKLATDPRERSFMTGQLLSNLSVGYYLANASMNVFDNISQ